MIGMAMKLDHEIIKKILLAFEKSETPYTDLRKIAELSGIDYTDNRLFYHCELLADQGLIVGQNGSSNIGIGSYDFPNDIVNVSLVNIRLSAMGHEYIAAIKKPEIWEKTKKVVGEGGLAIMVETAKSVLQGFINSKVGI